MNVFRRIRWWLTRHAEARALRDEMTFHEEMKRRELERGGLAPAAATAAARRAMGNTTLMREDSRAVWFAPWLERLGQDIRFALRSARKNPAFSLGVVAITGLGVGATTTMFSVVDGVILKPLPYPGAERLIYFDWGSHSPPRFRDWQREMPAIEMWGGAWTGLENLVGGGQPERLHIARTTPDFFTLFAARPGLGRLFGPADFAGSGEVAVVSDRLWRRRFGGDSTLVGKTIELGGRRLEVVGVLDQTFVEPEQISRSGGLSVGAKGTGTDVWMPLVLSVEIAADHRYSILDLAARLRPGVTIAAFRQELASLAPRLAAANPEIHGGEDGPFPIPVMPLQTAIVGDADRALTTLLAAVGLMLLIACANVTNLYLARSTDRQRELAVRAAIGAGRGRLVRQLVTESVTLGVLAGAVGIALAVLGVRILVAVFPGDLPRAGEVAVDGRVLTFAVVISVVTGVVFGLVPAWSMRERRTYDAIRAGGSAAGPRRGRLRSALVIAEVALALMLMVGSGLLFHSLLRLIRVDPGFDPGSLTMARLQLGEPYTPERRANFAIAIRDRLARAPGMAEVAIGVAGPMARTGGSRCCWGHSKVTLEGGKVVEGRVLIHPVGERYFETMIARVHGTTFTDTEASAAPFPAVISDRLATRLFGEADPIGQKLSVADHGFVVRGVVSGFHQFGLDQDTEPEIFVPYARFGSDFDALNVIVRASTPGAALAPLIRQAIAELEPNLPTADVAPVSELIHRSLAGPRFYGLLMGAFAGLALALAAAGIYASMLYAVRQRTRELGIRLALGAQGRDVARMVVADASRLALGGLLLGALGALGLSKGLRAFLFGVEPTDPLAFAAAIGLLGATVLAAAYWPARRASRADPLEVLRAE
ncbi:MAG: ABC transporter permease [Gemmatimonadales bacterium]